MPRKRAKPRSVRYDPRFKVEVIRTILEKKILHEEAAKIFNVGYSTLSTLIRTLFLPVSYRQVRTALAEQNLLLKKPRKKRKPTEPKSFERARPIQMWQSDITPLPLEGGTVFHLIYEQAMKAEIQKRLRQNEKALSLEDAPPSPLIG